MKSLIVLLFLVPFFFSFAEDDPCKCEPKVGKERPYRLPAKWEEKGSSFHRSHKVIKPVALFSWEDKYSRFANENTVDWKTTRLAKTPEESLYTLKGWLWFVKIEEDCDFHIQIGKKSKGAYKRAVVEVTIKQCELQKIILDTLFNRGYTISKIKKGVELTTGIPVTVEGLGFYDWQHKTKEPGENTKEDSPLWKQEGTAWELHPIISMKFEK